MHVLVPLGQDLPQPPQWLVSVLVFTHAPLQPVIPVAQQTPLEFVKPTAQQMPPEFDCPDGQQSPLEQLLD
jgi:hypothetical protein